MANNQNDLQNMISNMAIGEKDAILNGLRHSGALIRANGIIFSGVYKYNDDSIIAEIKKLKNDTAIVIGYTVSQIAAAALHILKIEEYCGKDEKVKELIESNFDF